MEENSKVLTTADFITRLADKGYTKKDSAVILSDVLAVIYEAIEAGETIRLIGFGTFSVYETPAMRRHNVTTGEFELAPPHKRVKFAPGLTLRRAVEQAGI